MAELPTYVLERTFDAPRPLVWKAWTDPALLPRWYGPNAETIIHRHELKPGGLWLTEMIWGGSSKYERIEFAEVHPPERLVWLHSSADADWSAAAPQGMPHWPRVLLTTVTFDAVGDRTKATLTWTPFEASAAEIVFFAGVMDRMGKGWNAGMEMLDKLLAELRV